MEFSCVNCVIRTEDFPNIEPLRWICLKGWGKSYCCILSLLGQGRVNEMPIGSRSDFRLSCSGCIMQSGFADLWRQSAKYDEQAGFRRCLLLSFRVTQIAIYSKLPILSALIGRNCFSPRSHSVGSQQKKDGRRCPWGKTCRSWPFS